MVIIYYGLVAFLACLYQLLKRIRFTLVTRKAVFLAISFLCLFLLSGLRRYDVGTDTMQFVSSYEMYAQSGLEIVSFGQIYEPGYMLYMWILSRISPNARLLLMVSAAITNLSIISFIGRYSKDYFLSCLIYILSCQFLVSMCMLRQFLAIAIVLFGFRFLLNKKYLFFFFTVLLAATFHYFSLIILILIPIHAIRHIPTYVKVGATFLFILIFAFLPQIVIFLLTNISNYADYLPYLQSIGELQGGLRLPPMLLVFGALMVPLALNYRVWYGNNGVLVSNGRNWKFLYLVYCFLLALIILSARFGLFTRVYYYFVIFLVLLPNIQNADNTNKWRIYLIIVLLMIFTVSVILNRGTYNAQEYYFFWQ